MSKWAFVNGGRCQCFNQGRDAGTIAQFSLLALPAWPKSSLSGGGIEIELVERAIENPEADRRGHKYGRDTCQGLFIRSDISDDATV